MAGKTKSWVCVGLITVSALLGCTERSELPVQAAGPDLQAKCDAAIAAQVAPSRRDSVLTVRRLPGDGESTVPLGATLHNSRWVTLDAGRGVLVSLRDRDTAHPRTRLGQGPGELDLSGLVGFQRQQLQRLNNGFWLISDARGIVPFAPSLRPLARIPRIDPAPGFWDDHGIAAWSDTSAVIARSRASQGDSAALRDRRRLEIREVFPARGETRLLATIHNFLSFSQPQGEALGFEPFWSPYRDIFARTWDATDGNLIYTSFVSPGLCVATRQADSWRVVGYRSPGERPVVDNLERARVLRLYGVPKRDPLGPPGELERKFADRWPAFPPPYEDLVVSSDSIIWAERSAGGGESIVDIFRIGQGYLGSFDPERAYGRRALPIAMSKGRAVVTAQAGGAGVMELELVSEESLR